MKKIIISTILIGLLLTVPITNVNGSINKKTAMETKITPVIKKEILPLFDSQYRILPNLTRSKLLDQIKFQPGELIIGFKKDIEATISIFPEEAPITNLENIDTLNKEYKVTSFKKIFENDQSSDFSNVF